MNEVFFKSFVSTEQMYLHDQREGREIVYDLYSSD